MSIMEQMMQDQIEGALHEQEQLGLKVEIMGDIKKIKDFYGISREALHVISGISADALMRYERGEEPPHPYQLLISAMLNIETFETFFHLSKAQLKAADIERIGTKILGEMRWRYAHVREYRYKVMCIGEFSLTI